MLFFRLQPNVYTIPELYIHCRRCIYMDRKWVKNRTLIVRVNNNDLALLDKLVAAEMPPFRSSRSSVIIKLITAAVRKLEAKPE